MIQNRHRSFSIKSYRIAVFTVWCLIALAAGYWLYWENREFNHSQILAMARMGIEKDITFRRWAAQHGGVYVPVSDATPPNPWLRVPERDISTPSGRLLTLMNPAYMTRQLFKVAESSADAPREHITSLKPIRPENAADPWETQALKQFETGLQELGEFQTLDGEPVYRYMRPLLTENSCLKCHADQGYREGMVRGGISITIPLTEFVQATKFDNLNHLSVIFGIWLVGMAGIQLGFRRIGADGAALVSERDNLDAVFDTTPMPLLLLDQGLKVKRVNAAFREYCANFDATPDRPEQRCCMLLSRPDAIAEPVDCGSAALCEPCQPCNLMDNLRQLAQCADQENTELQIPREEAGGDTAEIWLRCSTRTVALAGCSYRLLSFMDISESRRLQDRLQKQAVALEEEIDERNRMARELETREQEYRSLAESSPDFIIRYDREGRTRYINLTLLRRLELDSLDVVIGKRPDEVWPDGRFAPIQQAAARAVESGELQTVEFSTVDNQEEPKFEHILIQPERDRSGRIIGTIAFGRDISKRKQLEEQLRQAQKMESIGRLAGGVAHDFNNMLGVIIGHAEMALLKLQPEQLPAASLQEIRKAAERSAGLTRQLLGFARQQTVSPQVLDLNETVSGMLEMLRRLIGEDIDLLWRPEAVRSLVKIDPAQLDQLLVNLCVNARDAIADVGKLTIETQAVHFDEAYCAKHPGTLPGEFVMLAVSDDGCGMDKKTLDKIFEPFYTTKERGKGTGLGLATVYGIVKQNQGFIYVYSEPQQGTTFKIYLPRYTATNKTARKLRSATAVALPAVETILLVEDEPAYLTVSQEMLEGVGYRVLAAATPGEALRLAEEHSGEIQLLLTDVVMPEMNGRELAQKLKKQLPELKLLFMSGYTTNVIAHHGILDAEIHFLQKPYVLETLVGKVREALDSE